MSENVLEDWWEVPGQGYYVNIRFPQIVRKKVSKTGHVLNYDSYSGRTAPPPYPYEVAEVTIGHLSDPSDPKLASLAALPPTIFAIHTTADPGEVLNAADSISQLNAAFAAGWRVRVEGYLLQRIVAKQQTAQTSKGLVVLPSQYVDKPLRDFITQNPHPYITHVSFVD